MEIYHRVVDAGRAAKLDFILIGGHAVNARGYLRTTVDFDFLIRGGDLSVWKQILENFDYEAVRIVDAFAQFQPNSGTGFRVDLMLVDEATFEKVLAGSDVIEFGHRQVHVASVLHLIALKLHAMRVRARAVQGKDYYDVLNLVQKNAVDVTSPEFQEMLERYATPSIRERLLRDLSL